MLTSIACAPYSTSLLYLQHTLPASDSPMKEFQCIRRKVAKVAIVETNAPPLPVHLDANANTNDAANATPTWGSTKAIIISTAKDIVSKLPLLPKLRQVYYHKRWMALVDLLVSRKAQPGMYANALLTLQREIDVQLDEAKAKPNRKKVRMIGLVVLWKPGHLARACRNAAVRKVVKLSVTLKRRKPRTNLRKSAGSSE